MEGENFAKDFEKYGMSLNFSIWPFDIMIFSPGILEKTTINFLYISKINFENLITTI